MIMFYVFRFFGVLVWFVKTRTLALVWFVNTNLGFSVHEDTNLGFVSVHETQIWAFRFFGAREVTNQSARVRVFTNLSNLVSVNTIPDWV